jgi:hypothetical protein
MHFVAADKKLDLLILKKNSKNYFIISKLIYKILIHKLKKGLLFFLHLPLIINY